MRCVIMASLILLMMCLSIAGADEKPAGGNLPRYYQTLEGMPVPSNVLTVGTLNGIIQTKNGEPLAGAYIYFFNVATGPSPVPEKYWRFFDEFSKLDDKGGFSVGLPPGRYYIIAVQRKEVTSVLAPPADGDIFYYEDNKYEVFSGLQNNLGVLSGSRPFVRNNLAKGDGVTAIAGKVFDAAGNPVENAIVASYTSSAVNGMPLFGSDLTDKDGGYLLRVAGAGTYYLSVREIYGLGAVEGEFKMSYGGNNPKGLKIKAGEIVKGIDLTGDKFIRPAP